MLIIKTETAYSRFYNKLKHRIYKKVTHRSLKLFLRGKDLISEAPSVDGFWEEELNQVINYYVKDGYSDFLVDIGANIGLTSCQNGTKFKEVWCFEPNPMCSKILEVNLAISLNREKFNILNYGIGSEQGKYDLYIPKHNWGGAFIKEKNTYSSKLLANKDGFKQFDDENYLIEEVEILESSYVLSSLFAEIKAKGYKKGFVKIDVEGYELTVLEGLAKCIPSDFSLIIIFENWDSEFDFVALENLFQNRSIVFKRIRTHFINNKYPALIKFIFQLLGKRYTQGLESFQPSMFEKVTGDIILKID